MAKGTKKASEPVLNYEAKLWQMADALRDSWGAEGDKHSVLGLDLLRSVPSALDHDRIALP